MVTTNYFPRVHHFKVHPIGLDDFTTQWLYEFLILGLWSTDYFGSLKCIDYVCSPVHKFSS